jgi:hypothetical protein
MLRLFLRQPRPLGFLAGRFELRFQPRIRLHPETGDFGFEGFGRSALGQHTCLDDGFLASPVGVALSLLLHRARGIGFDPETFDLGLNLCFGLGACPCNFVGQCEGCRFFCSTASVVGRSLLVLAARALGFLAHPIDLTLKLPIGIRAHTRKLICKASFGVGLDARDFLRQGARGRFFGRCSGLLKLALPHGCRLGLHASHVLGLGALGSLLRALQLFGESLVGARAHSGQFVGQLSLGLFANLSKFGAEGLACGGFGLCSCLCHSRFALRGGLDFDSSQFGRTLFRGLSANSFELGRHFRGGFPLRRGFRFDSGYFGSSLLRRFRPDALDFGRHLGGHLALSRCFGFDPSELGGAQLRGFGTHAFDFGRHPGIGLCLNERNLRGVDLGVHGLCRPGSVPGSARPGKIVDGDVELALLIVLIGLIRIDRLPVGRNVQFHWRKTQIGNHRIDRTRRVSRLAEGFGPPFRPEVAARHSIMIERWCNFESRRLRQ